MESWLDEAILKLKERDARCCDPYKEVYENYDKLFERYWMVEKSRAIARHRIILLEHEFHELLAKRDLKLAIEKFKKGIQAAQQDLIPPELSANTNQPILNLSKEVYEKNVLIQRQSEEIASLKTSLQTQSLELDSTRNEVELLRISMKEKDDQLNQLHVMMNSMEDLVRSLKDDKNELTERLITEKEKAAIQINEMNTMLEGIFKDIVFYSFVKYNNHTLLVV